MTEINQFPGHKQVRYIKSVPCLVPTECDFLRLEWNGTLVLHLRPDEYMDGASCMRLTEDFKDIYFFFFRKLTTRNSTL